MTNKVWFCFALSAAAALLATAAGAATVLEKTVSIAIRPDDAVLESTRLRIRLETDDDLDTWSSYSIRLDDNRSLIELEAFATCSSGRRFDVRRRDQDTVARAAGGSFYESDRDRRLSFRDLAVGHVLTIDYAVEVRPYFPAGRLALAGDEPIERLRVTVTGGGADWRWRLDGPTAGLALEEIRGGVKVSGNDLPAVDPPELAPGGAAVWPTLRYAWGSDATWQGVGRWYAELLSSLPRASEPVRRQATELIAGLGSRRQRLEALLEFMRRQVRYTAVQIGIGGFRPTDPATVLARRWGDCKDKALLLVDLLAAAGIDAAPALILSGDGVRIDRQFPSPWQFNHVIVAVPESAVEPADDDPVAGGYLFLDPTQTRGSARWLHPGVQDQDALVVHDGGGALIRTPIRQNLEHHLLQVDLEIDPRGDARGKAVLRLTGRAAWAWQEALDGAPPERAAEVAVSIFADLLPGATLEELGWTAGDDDVPVLDLGADLSHPGLVRGRNGRRSFRLAGAVVTPEPKRITDTGTDSGAPGARRAIPVVLPPHSVDSRWRLRLPAGWCPPPGDDQRVVNDLGFFQQRIVHESDSAFIVQRRAELRRRWIEPSDLPQLEELARAEHRSRQRRIRLVLPLPSQDSGCQPAPRPTGPLMRFEPH